MARKKSKPSWFKMFDHQKALIDSVSDEVAGKALKSVFQYFDDRESEPKDLDGLTFAVFSAIKPYVDESYDDYEKSVSYGRKGGQAKQANKEKLTPPNPL